MSGDKSRRQTQTIQTTLLEKFSNDRQERIIRNVHRLPIIIFNKRKGKNSVVHEQRSLILEEVSAGSQTCPRMKASWHNPRV